MALYVLSLVAALPSILLGADLSIDIENALLADVLADDCITEDSTRSALSLLQTDAVLQRKKRPGAPSAPAPGNLTSAQKTVNAKVSTPSLPLLSSSRFMSGSKHVRKKTKAGRDEDQASMPDVSFFQLDAEVERPINEAVSKETKQQVGVADTSGMDWQASISDLGKQGAADPGSFAEFVDPDPELWEGAFRPPPKRQEGVASTHTLVHTPHHNWRLPAFILCLVTFVLIASLTWALYYRSKLPASEESSSCNVERAQVLALQRCTAHELSEKLPSDAGYDCVLSRPLTSGQPVRLEARIEGSADGSAILSPLQKHHCVKFSAAAYYEEKDGMRSHPLALHSASVNFVVSLADAPETRIEVLGDDVACFDMHEGYCNNKISLASSPDHWKEFVLTWQLAGTSSKFLNGGGEVFEFRESALVVGSRVTLVGELQRDATGRLRLQPWRRTEQVVNESWKTSWEQSGNNVSLGIKGQSAGESLGKVLASDDPALLSTAFQRIYKEWTKRACDAGQAASKAAQSTRTAFSACYHSHAKAEVLSHSFAVPPVLKPGVVAGGSMV